MAKSPQSAGALDDDGFHDVGMLAYAAKYASVFTARSGTRSTCKIAGGGDRRGTSKTTGEPLASPSLEVAARHCGGRGHRDGETALPYLDVLADVRASVDVPCCVSGLGRVRDARRQLQKKRGGSIVTMRRSRP